MSWHQRFSSVVIALFAALTSAAQSNNPPVVRPVSNPPILFVSLERAKPDLDRFARSLQDEPESKGYYGVSVGAVACEGEEEFIAALIKGYLVRERGVSESRLVYVKGGSAYRLRLATGLVPPGAKTPQAAVLDGYPATHLPYNSRGCSRLRRQWRRGAAPERDASK